MDWRHFDLILGLGRDLLPVVSNPKAVVSPQSTLKGLGKTPSLYNGQRHAVGIRAWTQREVTQADLDRWSSEPDYGICVRTGQVMAIDIDDDAQGEEIEAFINNLTVAALPARTRSNSGKRLLVFRLPPGVTWTKRSFKTNTGMVELLGKGQQFIACGTHPSGVRYDWGALPDDIPTLDEAAAEALWRAVVGTYAVEPEVASGPGADRSRPDLEGVSDDVALYLEAEGLVLGGQDGKVFVTCPWKDGHSGDSGISETAWLIAGTRGYEQGHFDCRHASCAARKNEDFLDAVGFRASAFEDLDADDHTSSALNVEARFRVRSVKEVLAADRPTWLVKNLLPKAGLAVVYGASGSGKTFWVLDLVLHVALGESWRGKQTRPGRVIYLPAESQGGFRNRVEAVVQHYGLDTSDVGSFGVVMDVPNLMTVDDQAMAAQAKAWGGADIIVIDTLAQVTPGANENSSEDLGKAMHGTCQRQ